MSEGSCKMLLCRSSAIERAVEDRARTSSQDDSDYSEEESDGNVDFCIACGSGGVLSAGTCSERVGNAPAMCMDLCEVHF